MGNQAVACALKAAVAAGLAALLLVVAEARRRRRSGEWVTPALRARLGLAPPSRAASGLLVLAAAALGAAIALARHPVGSGTVLAIDLSNSMRVTDAPPDRLERARAAALRLAREAPAPLGLVGFAGRAFAFVPLTMDRGAVLTHLAAADPSWLSQTGSSLAAALRQAAALAVRAGPTPATVVLLTDGDALEPWTAIAAEALRYRRLRIPLLVVGVGTLQGGPVPDIDPVTGRLRGVKRETRTGAPVRSVLREPLLRELARRAQGRYVRLESNALPRLASATNPRWMALLLAAAGVALAIAWVAEHRPPRIRAARRPETTRLAPDDGRRGRATRRTRPRRSSA